MDLSVKYLNLPLRNPVIVSSSTLTDNIGSIQEIADSGAGAVVLRSLFEEQIMDEINAKMELDDMYFWYPEAADLVKSISINQGARSYLNLIEKARKTVDIPVIASVSCITANEWTAFAKQLENAGAQAVELNIATLIPDKEEMDSQYITELAVNIVKEVKKVVKIPVSVKINPVPSSQISMALKLEKASTDGMVLFNREYAPDINIDDLSVITTNYLSVPEEMAQSLRWIGILSQRVGMDLAASTGIHDHEAVIKQLLAGATVTQVCSTLFKNGISYLIDIIRGLEDWMSKHNYQSVQAFRGLVSHNKLTAVKFERVQHLKKYYQS